MTNKQLSRVLKRVLFDPSSGCWVWLSCLLLLLVLVPSCGPSPKCPACVRLPAPPARVVVKKVPCPASFPVLPPAPSPAFPADVEADGTYHVTVPQAAYVMTVISALRHAVETCVLGPTKDPKEKTHVPIGVTP